MNTLCLVRTYTTYRSAVRVRRASKCEQSFRVASREKNTFEIQIPSIKLLLCYRFHMRSTCCSPSGNGVQRGTKLLMLEQCCIVIRYAQCGGARFGVLLIDVAARKLSNQVHNAHVKLS